MKQRIKTFEELEQAAGIKRTVSPAPTKRDVANLTAKRLARSPFWKKKR